jgi:hypothetical protein
VTEPATFAVNEDNAPAEGAVKRFRVADSDYYAMCPMGEGVVLFSGEKETTLTYVTRENRPVKTMLTGLFITPDDPSVQANQEGISYYTPDDHCLVFLNLQLRPLSRVPLSAEVPPQPVLSKDWKLLYYYSQDALRCLNLRSGISRLLKESSTAGQQVCRLLFDGTLLECRISEGEQNKTLLISTQTGETRFSTGEPLTLVTSGLQFFASWQDLDQKLWLFGSYGDAPSRLLPLWDEEAVLQLNREELTVCRKYETGIELAWYDLAENGRYSHVLLENIDVPVGLVEDGENGEQWLLSREKESGKFVLYSWDPALSQSQEPIQTIAPYYTAQSPDTEGLERCEELVQPLRDQYGLKIRLWQDGIQTVPDGYQFTPEHSVEVYERCLPLLEKAIQAYPEELYKKLSKKSANKKLTICLVREITGSDELGSPTKEQGVYFIKDGSIYLVLTINDQIESSYYHELFHAMDSYIIVEAKTYDEWGSLNPKGFSYDHSYRTNENRDPKDYLEAETRAFIDIYSMSYPKEDRARIMEYAMQDGNEEYFTSEIMSKKLETLCKGIRKAFKLNDDEGTFPWEQYLSE